MKKLLLIGLFLVSRLAYAWTDLHCVTPFPTTSFLLLDSGETIDLTVIHHNGTDYMPVYNGVVTPADLDMIRERGEFFTKLGRTFTINFPKENCKHQEGSFFYNCHSGTPVEINGQKLDMAYFFTTTSVDRIPDMEFPRTNVALSLRQNGWEYRMEYSYYGQDCLQDGSKGGP